MAPSSTKTQKMLAPASATETGTETRPGSGSWMYTQVELETAGQRGCPERDSNPYDLSVREV